MRASAAVPTTEPARCVGGGWSQRPAARAGRAAVRRLGAEIEMWLHWHPVNAARADRGSLPSTALWFWGAERAPRWLRPRPLARRPPHGAPSGEDGLAFAGVAFGGDLTCRALRSAFGALAQRGAGAVLGYWRRGLIELRSRAMASD